MKKQFTELIGVYFTLVLLLIGTSSAQAQYCELVYTNTSDDWISNVEFAGIDNPSESVGYEDYTDITGVVVPGASYQISVTIGNAATYNEDVTVFIDFNQDEVFNNDPSERFDIGSCASNGCTVVGDILIPLSATPGITRMRVVEDYSFAVGTYAEGPCNEDFTGTPFYGEAEDYTLLIGGDCTPPDFAYTITDDCELFTYDVTATINDMGGDLGGPNSFVTIYLTRSDAVPVSPVTVPDFLIGQTLNIILDVPFGVSVSAAVEGNDPTCNSSRNWSEIGLCPPQNNECETALEALCDVVVSGSTINGSPYPEGLDICTANANGSGAVWYEYTAPYNSIVSAAITPTFDAQHAVYSGECGDLTCLGSSDFNPVQFNANAGETFYVMVFGWGTAQGDFDLIMNCTELTCDFPELTAIALDGEGIEITEEDCIPFEESYSIQVSLEGGAGNETFTVNVAGTILTMAAGETNIVDGISPSAPVTVTAVGDDEALCDASATVSPTLCPPTNDLCADAFVATCGGGPYLGTTLTSTSNPDQEYCAGTGAPSATNGGVWYTFTIENTSEVDVDLSGSDYDTKLWIYSGACDDLTCILGNDDGGTGLDSRIVGVYPAGTYFAYVTGIGTARGDYVLNISCIEYLCNAPTATITAVDDEGVEIDGCLSFSNTYNVLVDLTGGEGNDTYTVTVGNNSMVMTSPSSETFEGYNSGTNVSVEVAGDQDPLCDATYSVTVPICPAENDLCADAIEAICGQTYGGTTVGATSVPGQSYCGTTAPATTNGGVWYSFNLDSDADIDIDLSGSAYDTKLFLYSGTCDGLVCVDGDDDGGDGVDSRIQGLFTAGDYYIYVTGYSGNSGVYIMNISCVDVECSPNVTASAVDSEGIELTDCVDQTGDYYVLVAVSGGANNDFYNITINGDDYGQVAAEGSVVVGPFTATTTANVSVTGDTQITCSGTANASPVICPPSNDLPCDAIPIAVDGLSAGIFTNVNSTADVGEPSPIFGNNQSVWFSLVGPESGRVNVSLCSPNTDFDTGLILYAVEDCGDYSTYLQIAFNIDNNVACGNFFASELEACVEPGVTHYVSVVGYASNTGNFEITATEVDGSECYDCEGVLGGTAVAGNPCETDEGAPGIYGDDCSCIPVPANDLCGDAIAISCGDVIEGSTVNSSTLDVPGTCGTTPGTGGGIWYSITGTGGNIIASMCGSTYDTKINVYTGDCGALTCVTGIDDFCGLQSEVNWDSEFGVEYLIYVNGFSANVGDFTLAITCEVVSAASINGTVDWNAECGDRDLTVDFYELGTDVLVASYDAAVNAAGEFTLPDVAVGTFDVITKVDGFLAVGSQAIEVAVGPNALDLGALTAGDINGDNGINIQDVSFMNAAFGSTTGDANFNPLADTNCDGGVNIQDVSTLNAGFGQSGAEAPLL